MRKQVNRQAKPKPRVDVAGWEHWAYVSVAQAAVILARGKTVVWEKVYAGELLSIKDGARRLIPTFALKTYIAERNAENGVNVA